MIKFKIFTHKTRIASAIFLIATVAGAQTQSASDSSFGVEVGKSSCEHARTTIDAKASDTLSDNDILLHAANPSSLYEGATKLLVRCRDGKVIGLQMTAAKGFGNSETAQTHANLRKKYKQVAGGAMPRVGDGYAKFQSKSTIIELESPHMSFDYTLTYYAKPFFEGLKASKTATLQKKLEAKERAL